MPAIAMHARPTHERSLRAYIVMVAAIFLASAGLSWPAVVDARDLTPQIVATRNSQLYYESVMRAADRDVRTQKRAHKRAKRQLKAARRRVRKISSRQRAAKASLTGTRSRLQDARLAVVGSTTEVPPPPDAAIAALVLQERMSPEPLIAEEWTADGWTTADDSHVTLLAFDPTGTGSSSSAAAFGGAGHEVTLKDVVRLEKKVKKGKRKVRSVKRKVGRAKRNVRIRRSRLAAAKARHRYAIARRESAEAVLGGRILAMARLAQRRAAKNTRERPGVNSSFVWPARGRISQTYGCTGYRSNPRRGSCRHFHDGLDIVSYRGAPIRAAATGVVSYIGWNPWDQHGRAFMIVVAHRNGYETLYGHVLPTRRVRVGELVKRGHIIGYMGSTGRSTGVHLHFELRRGRTTINPLGHL